MIPYYTMSTKFEVSSVLVWTVYMSVSLLITCETLDGSTWSVASIPRESTSTSIASTSVVIPMLISLTFVSLIVLIVWRVVFLITLCNYIGLIDCMIILSVIEIHMEFGSVMIFSFTDCTPRCLVVLHVERTIFCRVVSLLLGNVAKTFCPHESNFLSAGSLSTVVF